MPGGQAAGRVSYAGPSVGHVAAAIDRAIAYLPSARELPAALKRLLGGYFKQTAVG